MRVAWIAASILMATACGKDGAPTAAPTAEPTAAPPRTRQEVEADRELEKGVFEDKGDGTVAQVGTALVWQKDDSHVEVDWSKAEAYCAQLPLAGGGWRLPTIRELVRLIDRSRPMDQKVDPAFVDSGSWIWSSSPFVGNPYPTSWYVFVGSGGVGVSKQTDHDGSRARCVR